MPGRTVVSNSRQYGHCGSMNSFIVTGAVGLPRVVPLCGIPLKSVFTSAAPGRAFVSDPTAGTFLSELDEPPPSAAARTIAATIATTTTPVATRTRGEACLCLEVPAFRRSGGDGTRPACLRCLLALP